MLSDGPIKPAYVVLAVAIAAFALGVWLDAAQPRLCGPPQESCVREWFGALSGWFAGIAALITGWILLGQLRLMRRQTDFTLGLSDPTMIAVRPDSMLENVQLRIVNWNRSEIEITRLQLIRAPYPMGMGLGEALLDGETIELEVEPYMMRRIRVPGWTNRNDSPPSVTISLWTIHEMDDDPDAAEGGLIEVTFAADVSLLEERHRRVRLYATAAIDPTPM